MTALIISGGDYASIENQAWDYVIACDRGYLYAQKRGIRPDLILGDFDSAPLPDSSIPVEAYPAWKDDTDTMLAVRKALEKQYSEITIACAFGGRLDHTFANIQAAAYAAEHGTVVRLCGNDTDAWVFCGQVLRFPRRTGYSLSVFSISDSCKVTITGAEYECSDTLLRNTFPIGISNEWKEDQISVTAHSGILMVMESRIQNNGNERDVKSII